MTSHDHSDERGKGRFPAWRARVALLGFAAIAGALLFTEHRAHVLGALLYLPLLLCPLVHFFMHRGHGGHRGHGEHQDERRVS